jgi:exodeoxyribonuclease V gamma subunit
MVDRTVRAGTGPARDQVVTRHPLQPFDPRNFTPGALGADGPWSFDRVTLDGARALAGPREGPRPFLAAPLRAEAGRVVELDHLVAFAERPVRAFLRHRLGIRLADVADEVEDGLPVELDALEAWGVGQRLLDARLEGTGLDAAIAAERARGTLPPGRLAEPAVDRIRGVVEAIAAHAGPPPDAGGPGSVDVKVLLDGGRRLSGTVAGVRGTLLRTVTYSRVSARHRLAAWVRLLALTAADPSRPWEALTLGRVRTGVQAAQVTIARIGPLAADPATRAERALDHLGVLVDLHDRGMREPLPIACLASAAYAHAVATGHSPEAAGRRAWESEWSRPREDAELEHQLVLGGVRTFAEVLAEPPRPDEAGPGWDAADPTRFGRLARRLWAGILACEAVEDR